MADDVRTWGELAANVAVAAAPRAALHAAGRLVAQITVSKAPLTEIQIDGRRATQAMTGEGKA
ncbi:MAG: hypothetical protein LC130_28505 [Bryobacterales bacterium]|nr:hypothetical protein [Bryobacterales bacterium]